MIVSSQINNANARNVRIKKLKINKIIHWRWTSESELDFQVFSALSCQGLSTSLCPNVESWQSPLAHTLSKSWLLYLWKNHLVGEIFCSWPKDIRFSHHSHAIGDVHTGMTGLGPTTLSLLECEEQMYFAVCLVRTNLLCFAAPPTVWHWVNLPRQRLGDHVRHRVLLPRKVGPYLWGESIKTRLSQ